MQFTLDCEREDNGRWPLPKARRVFAARSRPGWQFKRQSGSHRTSSRESWPGFVFAFHDGEAVGPGMLTRFAKHTGLQPEDR